MKIIQPTLESFLEETNRVYIRVERIYGELVIIVGGFRCDGVWTEFHSRLQNHESVEEIIQHLGLIVYIIQEQKKSWGFNQELRKNNVTITFKTSRVRFHKKDKKSPFMNIDLGLN